MPQRRHTQSTKSTFLGFLPRENSKYKFNDGKKLCVCSNKNASVVSIESEEDSGMR